MKKFIVYEGLDACGKTTLSSLYAKERNSVVHSALVEEALELRKMIDDYPSKECALLFFLMNNFLKSNEVSKALESGDVILDRYIFSTLAYQTIMLGEDTVKKIFDTLNIANNIILPDVIVFIKADAETINSRIENRAGPVQWYGDAITQTYGRSVEENYQLMKGRINIALSGKS